MDGEADGTVRRVNYAQRQRWRPRCRPKSLARPSWQMALAARVSEYGISLDDAMWQMPIAALNQFIIYDELANGRKPRWHTDGEAGAKDIDSLLQEALTSGG